MKSLGWIVTLALVASRTMSMLLLKRNATESIKPSRIKWTMIWRRLRRLARSVKTWERDMESPTSSSKPKPMSV